jgi:sterol desaturase/sphingolipid hydroxylase (fatty acid hydroxylase superfamily)
VINPQYHRLHHSIRAEHLNHNFALLLPMWDHIFGTRWIPAKHEWPATGLDDGTQPHSLLGAFSWPLGQHAEHDAIPLHKPVVALDKKAK